MSLPFCLIIEDDSDLAIIFAKALEIAGYKTEVIQDGRLAEARLASSVPDLIVLDLHLPNVSGEQLLQKIRNDERLEKTRVILATADWLRGKLLEEKADIVLIKPISFNQLRLLSQRLHLPSVTGNT